MTIPAGNVRPSVYATGTQAPGESVDIGPGSTNTIFVITFIALSFELGSPGDYGWVQHSSQPIAAIQAGPDAVPPIVTLSTVETTLDDNFNHLEVFNGGASTLNYLIAGYFWCPEPPVR